MLADGEAFFREPQSLGALATPLVGLSHRCEAEGLVPLPTRVRRIGLGQIALLPQRVALEIE